MQKYLFQLCLNGGHPLSSDENRLRYIYPDSQTCVKLLSEGVKDDQIRDICRHGYVFSPLWIIEPVSICLSSDLQS